LLKALSPILVTLSGISIFDKLLLASAPFSIVITLFGISKVVNLLFSKIDSPITVILSGNLACVN
jgi:hypothetical protein